MVDRKIQSVLGNTVCRWSVTVNWLQYGVHVEICVTVFLNSPPFSLFFVLQFGKARTTFNHGKKYSCCGCKDTTEVQSDFGTVEEGNGGKRSGVSVFWFVVLLFLMNQLLLSLFSDAILLPFCLTMTEQSHQTDNRSQRCQLGRGGIIKRERWEQWRISKSFICSNVFVSYRRVTNISGVFW